MSVYKEEKTGTWRVLYRYTDWTGEKKQTQKRGFKTKREAQAWEREQMNLVSSSLDMTFQSFVERYREDKAGRIKENTWEMKNHTPAEAYKAQCVATHCWILSQSGYPSVLGAEPGAAALAAAQEVAHVLVTYNGQVCFTPYFASASTGTASAAEVWGNERAWLQAVDSPYDQQVATNWNTNGNSSGTARFARQTLQDRIRDVMDIDLSGVDPNSWFTIQSANQYGWVAKIQVGPDAGVGTVSGRWFRENLLARQSVDGRSLRSQCFTVSYNAELDCFIFDVYGYGHGCGMSQWGAIGYARNGWGYQDILTHYFVGTTITTY